MHPISTLIQKELKKQANATNAKSMKAYMLNQFEFLGVKTPERRAISKTVFKQNQVSTLKELETIVSELWNFEEREFHYIAIECLAYNKKLWLPQTIQLIEELTITKSWWDSVDAVASFVLTDYFKKFPSQILPITSTWNKSNNRWLQRNSIMFQKAFKKQTNTEILANHILHVAHSKEFFIQKAIGWALREYAKTNPSWVQHFVETHKSKLANLSIKEALKRL